MTDKQRRVIEKKREKRFQELKQRTEIKERYGVFTQKMFEDVLEELRGRIKEDTREMLDPLNEKLDWLIGAYKKFDEEYTLLSDISSEHTERLNSIEKKLGIYAN